MGNLTENFTTEEFVCKCGCGQCNVNKEFIDRLQFCRDVAGIPFIVRSGCRCEQHNEDVGSSPRSDHLTGEAADIKCKDSRSRYLILDAAYVAGFDRIGIYPTFIHLGQSNTNTKEVVWIA